MEKGWTGARGALQIYKGMPVPKCAPVQSKALWRACPAKWAGPSRRRLWWPSSLLLSSLTPNPRPPPSSASPPLPQHHSPGAHVRTHVPQTASSGICSSKAKANRVWKSSQFKNLTATIQKGQENSLGNSGLTLESSPQRSEPTKSKNYNLSSQLPRAQFPPSSSTHSFWKGKGQRYTEQYTT